MKTIRQNTGKTWRTRSGKMMAEMNRIPEEDMMAMVIFETGVALREAQSTEYLTEEETHQRVQKTVGEEFIRIPLKRVGAALATMVREGLVVRGSLPGGPTIHRIRDEFRTSDWVRHLSPE